MHVDRIFMCVECEETQRDSVRCEIVVESILKNTTQGDNYIESSTNNCHTIT